jgi:Fic family protein
MRLVEALVHQRDHHIEGNAYKFIQCDFAYNSNHIEGSTLTHDQTVSIYERDVVSGTAKVDDILEAKNHFDAFDLMLDRADEALSPELLKRFHATLKRATSAERDPFQTVGEYKIFNNEIAGEIERVGTAPVEDVPTLVGALLTEYESDGLGEDDPLRRMARLHWRFERIHPFSDGNGRVGRLILFKECLRADVTPFVITEDLRGYYIRGLREFAREPGYLVDTFGFAQDRFDANYRPMIDDYVERVARVDATEAGRPEDGASREDPREVGHER